MSEKVKLIVTLSKGQYENLKDIQFGSIGSRMIFNAVKNGIPLDNIDSDETKAYFDGQAYGWEEGRKALIEDLKAEIEKDTREYVCDEFVDGLNHALEIIDNIGKGDKE